MDRKEQTARPAEARNPVSADEMFDRVYAELRSLAAAKLSRERRDHTLNATAPENIRGSTNFRSSAGGGAIWAPAAGLCICRKCIGMCSG